MPHLLAHTPALHFHRRQLSPKFLPGVGNGRSCRCRVVTHIPADASLESHNPISPLSLLCGEPQSSPLFCSSEPRTLVPHMPSVGRCGVASSPARLHPTAEAIQQLWGSLYTSSNLKLSCASCPVRLLVPTSRPSLGAERGVVPCPLPASLSRQLVLRLMILNSASAGPCPYTHNCGDRKCLPRAAL